MDGKFNTFYEEILVSLPCKLLFGMSTELRLRMKFRIRKVTSTLHLITVSLWIGFLLMHHLTAIHAARTQKTPLPQSIQKYHHRVSKLTNYGVSSRDFC